MIDRPTATVGVTNRLMRGYGPLAILAVMLVLVAVLIPSKVPDTAAVTAGGPGASGTGGGGGTGGTGGSSGDPTSSGGGSGGGPGSPGTVASGGGGGGGGATGGDQAAGVAPCPDRADQVPGDPYSPPCITFSGDNGGATTKGVTADEIIVSFRVLNEKGFQQTLAELAGASLVDTPEDIRRTVSALADYFNQRFQFYGRQLRAVFYDGVGSNTTELLGGGRDKAEADAVTVAQEIGAFADLSSTSEPYADALVRRGVLAFGDPYLSRSWHEQRRPYAWSLATDGTKVASLAAEYAAKRLVGKPAAYAGGSLHGQPRRLATLAPENSWYQESVDVARSVISDAGGDPGVNVKYVLDLGTMSNQAQNIIPKLKSEGVTTVFCGCDPIMPVFLSGVANREGYYPEFVIVGTALTDTDIVGQLWNQQFASHAFGISSLTQPVPPTDTIAYEAYKTVRQDEPAFTVDLIYYQMYMLAVGVHMAGPHLTPETFEQGAFAYPARQGPIGLFDLGPGDYTWADDVREIYYDPDAVSAYNGRRGAFVETEPGVRYRAGEITAGDPKVPVR